MRSSVAPSPGEAIVMITPSLTLHVQLRKEAKDFAYNHLNCCGPVQGTFTLAHVVATLGSKHQTGRHNNCGQLGRGRKGERERGGAGAWLVSKSKSKAMGIFECNWLIDFDSFASSLRCFTRLHSLSWQEGVGRKVLGLG